MRRIIRLAAFTLFALAFGIFIAGSLLSYQQARFLVDPIVFTPGNPPLPNHQDVRFTTADDVTLRGWYYAPTHPSSGATILFIHGHAGNRDQFHGEAAIFHEMGYGLLLFDLRNHGNSDDAPTTMGLHEIRDVQAAFDFLTTQPAVDPERIALYGHSMGAATAIRAMARIPQARALVASAPYATLHQVISDGVRSLTFGLLSFPFTEITQAATGQLSNADVHQVRPIDDIAGIAPRPVLIIHGTEDEIIPVTHGERIYAAAGEPKQFFPVTGATHNNSFATAGEDYSEIVVPFIEAALRD